MTDTLPLIRTKLYRPRITADLVRRPRLLERLDRRRERPLTLVVAPAGYGKTTLVSTWLDTIERPNAWLSLDENDSNLGPFLTYFLAATRTIFPDAGPGTEALLKATTLPPVPVLARTLINDLDQLEGEFVLVLDDYHLIRERAVHDLLSELLRHPPRGLHLVLASRKDPMLPLATLRAKSQVTEVRRQDLRFTQPETAALMEQELGTGVDDRAAAALLERVEGWVTGMRLVILSLRHRDSVDLSPARLQGSVSYAMDYLVAEVLESQPRAIQDYLLNTAILDRFCAPLCEAVRFGKAKSQSSSFGTAAAEADEGGMSGQAFVEWLKESNVFVVPLDDQGEWYRYHHLFRELLQRRLGEQRGANGIAALHSRASAWFAQNRQIDEALHHALAAGEPETAVQLIAQHRHTLIDRELWQRLERWLLLFPRPITDESPELLMTEAWTLTWRGQWAEVSATLDQVQDRMSQEPLAPESAKRIAGEISLLQGCLVGWMADGPQMLSLAQSALEQLPAEWEYARGIALMLMSWAYHLLGEKDRTHESIYRALGERHRGGSYRSRLLTGLCTHYWVDADLPALEQASKSLVDLGQEFDLRQSLALGHYFLGCAYYHRNQLSLAEQHLTAAYGARFAIPMNFLVQSALALSLAYQASDKPEQARETVDETYELFQELQNYRLVSAAGAVRAELALRQGRIGEAGHWAQDYDPHPLLLMHTFHVPQLTLTRLLLAKDSDTSRQQAADLLAQVCEFVERTHNTRFRIEVLALQAQLDDVQDDGSAALDKLEQAVRLAEPGGWIRLFVDLGPRIAILLDQLHSRGVAPDYVAQILAAFQTTDHRQQMTALPTGGLPSVVGRPSSPVPNGAGELIDPLTNREHEVLALLAQQLSNKEIAARLVITPGTVKQHTHNIYQKLNVRTRWQAVIAATSLGILPSNSV